MLSTHTQQVLSLSAHTLSSHGPSGHSGRPATAGTFDRTLSSYQEPGTRHRTKEHSNHPQMALSLVEKSDWRLGELATPKVENPPSLPSALKHVFQVGWGFKSPSSGRKDRTAAYGIRVNETMRGKGWGMVTMLPLHWGVLHTSLSCPHPRPKALPRPLLADI